MLGQGTYAIVYKEGPLAVKVSRKGDYSQCLAKEIVILKGLDHPAIIKVQGVFLRDEALAFSMEAYKNTLFEKLDHMASREFSAALADVCAGLAYIHSAGIVHCDINPTNILLKDNGAVLCDFGLARTFPTSEAAEVINARYRAPEVALDDCPWGSAADVWAVGICILEFLCLYYSRSLGDTPDEKGGTYYRTMFRPLLDNGGNDPRGIPFRDLSAHFGKLFYMDWPLATVFCRCVEEKRASAVIVHKELCLLAGRPSAVTLAREPFSYEWLSARCAAQQKCMGSLLDNFAMNPCKAQLTLSETAALLQ
jgi:serine/threonine protein kinase